MLQICIQSTIKFHKYLPNWYKRPQSAGLYLNKVVKLKQKLLLFEKLLNLNNSLKHC